MALKHFCFHSPNLGITSAIIVAGRAHEAEIFILLPLFHSCQYFSQTRGRRCSLRRNNTSLSTVTLMAVPQPDSWQTVFMALKYYFCLRCTTLGCTSARHVAGGAHGSETLFLSPLSQSWQYFSNNRGRPYSWS
jgi:hypothetical protein